MTQPEMFEKTFFEDFKLTFYDFREDNQNFLEINMLNFITLHAEI